MRAIAEYTPKRGASGELDRELRSTLAALEELGPAYEPELAAVLSERLHRLRSPVVLPRRPERSVSGAGLPLSLVAALAVAGALLLPAVVHTHSASWQYGYYHRSRVAPFARGFVPAPPAPSAPALPSGTY